jgi:site-specific DNA recombinase
MAVPSKARNDGAVLGPPASGYSRSTTVPGGRQRRSLTAVSAATGRRAVHGMQGSRLYRPCRARPADRSLAAEDRSAEGVRDRTGPEPRACSRLAHGTVRHRQGWRGTATVTGEYDLATSRGRLHFRIKGAVARHESEHRAERLRLKHDEIARAGRHHGGPRPFGFEYEPVVLRDRRTVYRFTGRLEEAEAELIREAARRLLNGESVYGILADWELWGIRSPNGNLWLATSFRNMLTSPRIAGLRVHQGEIVGPATRPPILDRGTWEAVRSIFADRSGRRRLGRGSTFLLTGGTARCGAPGEATIGHIERICGKALVSCVNKAASYGCRPEAPHHGCGRVFAQRDHLEAFVTEMVIVALSGPGLAEARRAAAGNDQDFAALADQLWADEQALTQLARDHYVDRLISRAEFLAARQAIEARMEATHRALSERPRTGILLDVPSTEAKLRKAWETWTVDRRHAVVAAVLLAVVVGPARRGKRFDADRVTPIWRA